MATSCKPGERNLQPTDPELEADWNAAESALRTYWFAAIRWHIKAKSKRRNPSDAKVLGKLCSLGNHDFVHPLVREFLVWGRCIGKSGSEWSVDDTRQALRFAAKVLDEVRANVYERLPGKPSHRTGAVGLINSKVTPSSSRDRRTAKQVTRKELICYAAVRQRAIYAGNVANKYIGEGVAERDAYEMFGSLKALIEKRKSFLYHLVEKPLSSRWIAREFIEEKGLPRYQEDQLRKRIERLRPEILAAIKKPLQKQ